MGKFRVIKEIDFGSGYLHDRDGNAIPMQNFAPKIGDVIELGELQTKTLWSSAPMKGYDFIIHQDGVASNSLLWIMADEVVNVPSTAKVTNTTNKSSTSFAVTPENIIIGLITAGVVYGGWKWLNS